MQDNVSSAGNNAALFGSTIFLVLKDFIPLARTQELAERARRVAQHQAFKRGDELVPKAPAVYADPVMERLLQALLPRVEALVQRPLFPTYSYFRIYRKGDQLTRHKDRPACEYSLSISLDYDPDDIYPFMIDAGEGPQSILLGRGDALMYKGPEVEHWREPYSGTSAVQLFLFYVDQNGPHRQWKFDQREALFTGE